MKNVEAVEELKKEITCYKVGKKCYFNFRKLEKKSREELKNLMSNVGLLDNLTMKQVNEMFNELEEESDRNKMEIEESDVSKEEEIFNVLIPELRRYTTNGGFRYFLYMNFENKDQVSEIVNLESYRRTPTPDSESIFTEIINRSFQLKKNNIEFIEVLEDRCKKLGLAKGDSVNMRRIFTKPKIIESILDNTKNQKRMNVSKEPVVFTNRKFNCYLDGKPLKYSYNFYKKEFENERLSKSDFNKIKKLFIFEEYDLEGGSLNKNIDYFTKKYEVSSKFCYKTIKDINKDKIKGITVKPNICSAYYNPKDYSNYNEIYNYWKDHYNSDPNKYFEVAQEFCPTIFNNFWYRTPNTQNLIIPMLLKWFKKAMTENRKDISILYIDDSHGGTGKSTFMNAFQKFIEKHTYDKNSIWKGYNPKDNSEFSLATFYRKRFVMIGYNNNEHLLKTGSFQQFTGGDVVEMNKKYKDPFSARMFGDIIAMGNSQLSFSSVHNHVFRRICYVKLNAPREKDFINNVNYSLKNEHEWIKKINDEMLNFLIFCDIYGTFDGFDAEKMRISNSMSKEDKEKYKDYLNYIGNTTGDDFVIKEVKKFLDETKDIITPSSIEELRLKIKDELVSKDSPIEMEFKRPMGDYSNSNFNKLFRNLYETHENYVKYGSEDPKTGYNPIYIREDNKDFSFGDWK